MPPHTRSQRRRQAAGQKVRPNTSVTTPLDNAVASATVQLDNPPLAARPARSARRVATRTAPTPVDYSADYSAVGRDLRWILLWSALLFAAMIVLRVSGLV